MTDLMIEYLSELYNITELNLRMQFANYVDFIHFIMFGER